MEIGTYVRGLVDGMSEAVEVIYLTLIKKKKIFYFTKNVHLLRSIVETVAKPHSPYNFSYY
jgi:hypothetical protein